MSEPIPDWIRVFLEQPRERSWARVEAILGGFERLTPEKRASHRDQIAALAIEIRIHMPHLAGPIPPRVAQFLAEFPPPAS